MRIGQNPLRYKSSPSTFKDIVFVVVTHLPCEDPTGYHKDRMDVVKTCLQTMRWGAHRDHTFMVWDNNSKSEFRDWLQHIFEPDILVMSGNIGKTNARAAAINMLPMSSVVCYSDDDMLYYDNWLKPQLELLNHFPNVAAVSGYPLRIMFRWGVENTVKWAHENGKLERGRFMPKEWEVDYCESVGKNYDFHIQDTLKDVDYRVTYNGKQAYTTAHHCQFIGYAVKLAQVNQFDDRAMNDEKPFDIALDQVGLRLATTQRLVRHIGNVLDEKIRQDVPKPESLSV
jgi:hypothetical protein